MKKITPEDPLSASADITAENIDKLRELFPELLTESGDGVAVNVDVLKSLVGDQTVTDADEKYGLSWHGKRMARQLALTPSTGTLRPCPEESVDWDSTQNVFIEGDNLEVLKLLQKSYANKVKMIYIDPPYNTDNDFVYKDSFKDSIQNYKEITGQVDEDGNRLRSEFEKHGRWHTNWLNMIYPRLIIARNLLEKDGLILIHIDEHERANLISIMDEIFGSENCIGEIIWDKKNPKGDANKIAVQHEYIIVYAHTYESYKLLGFPLRPKLNAERILRKASQLYSKIGKTSIPLELKNINQKYSLDLNLKKYSELMTREVANNNFKEWIADQDSFSGGESAYKYLDEDGDVFQPVSMAWPNKKKAPDEYFFPLYHPKTNKQCPVPERGWRNPPRTMQSLLNKDLIVFGDDENTQPRRKYLLCENMMENLPSILRYGGSDDRWFTQNELVFDNPKPFKFVADVIRSLISVNDGIVLDFFSGSASTAHATMQLNAEDGGNIKHIMVQLPEVCDEKSAAAKAGYKTIAEISKERIRRAGTKIKEDNADKEGIDDLDIGFRVFKLDSSNINEWRPKREDIAESLEDHAEHIKDDRSEDDLLYELLLKLGLDLCIPIEQKEYAGLTVHNIGAGTLFVCLATEVKAEAVEELAEGISAWAKGLEAQEPQCVFRDSGFSDNKSKSNLTAILNQHGIKNIRSI